MAVTITIGGVDKSRSLVEGSIRIQNILTKQVDTCQFDVLTHTGKTYAPTVGKEVIILDGATRIFGGVITRVTMKPEAYGTVVHSIDCVDYTRLLDKKLVAKTYRSQTIDTIIADLKTNYFPSGFTTTAVDAPITISIQFKYLPLSKCLQELAELVNYDWYVDYNKDVHFFSKEENSAPFSLSDSDGSYRYDSLVIRRDNSQLRNTIIVRGGEYIGSTLTTEFIADGSQNTILLPYRYQDFKTTVTGQVLNLGIDNIDNPDNFDALYNFQEKIVKFRNTRKPTIGSAVRVSGKPYLPVIVKYKSQPNINSTISVEGGDGIYEYLIIDKSINSKEDARKRAQAEVITWATTLSEGTFITEISGLKAGQRIRVVSASRGIDEYFMINRVVTTQFGHNTFLYNVSLITTRTFDVIDILQRLLLAETKKLDIDPNETVDLVEAAPEEITLTDSVTAAIVHNTETETVTLTESFTNNGLNFGTIFVAGPWTPSTTKRVFVVNGSRLG